jgi:hypothetical protein
MLTSEYLSMQEPQRSKLLEAIHEIIIESDKTVVVKVNLMSKIHMIQYFAAGIFKYGLANTRNYMSLHLMPIYGVEKLHTKYRELLPRAKFQKGCINFKSADEMPLDIVRQLLEDCAKIDLMTIMADLKKGKRAGK